MRVGRRWRVCGCVCERRVRGEVQWAGEHVGANTPGKARSTAGGWAGRGRAKPLVRAAEQSKASGRTCRYGPRPGLSFKTVRKSALDRKYTDATSDTVTKLCTKVVDTKASASPNMSPLRAERTNVSPCTPGGPHGKAYVGAAAKKENKPPTRRGAPTPSLQYSPPGEGPPTRNPCTSPSARKNTTPDVTPCWATNSLVQHGTHGQRHNCGP